MRVQRIAKIAGAPLQSLLIGLKLMAGIFGELAGGHPGCLVASMCYQERLFDREVRDLISQSVTSWNEFFAVRLRKVVECSDATDIDVMDLAQSVSCIVDGAIIMGRALSDSSLVARQLLLLRSHIKLVFQSALMARQAA